jgi:hypothetical protein
MPGNYYEHGRLVEVLAALFGRALPTLGEAFARSQHYRRVRTPLSYS